MGHFYQAVKAGIRGVEAGNEPAEFSIAGRIVKCPHCGKTKFTSPALVNTSVATIFKGAWADSSATVLTCAERGRIEWVVRPRPRSNLNVHDPPKRGRDY